MVVVNIWAYIGIIKSASLHMFVICWFLPLWTLLIELVEFLKKSEGMPRLVRLWQGYINNAGRQNCDVDNLG